MTKKKAVVLFSGGIDSLAALLWARDTSGPEQVFALYCNVGQKYAQKEIRAFTKICEMLNQEAGIETRLQLGDYEDPNDPNAIIPYRNSFFILLAAAHIEEWGRVITQNLVRGETTTWDRRPEFNQAMHELLQVADTRRVTLMAPHAGKTKTEILKYIMKNGLASDLTEELILSTVGCYTPGLENCGRCKSCFRSYVAMVNAGFPYPERRFAEDPIDWEEGIERYVKDMLADKYDQVRVDETFRALHIKGVLKLYVGDTYAVDLDGTLTDTGPGLFNSGMTPEEIVDVYLKASPIQEAIDKVNKLYDENNDIIIHTARYGIDRRVTEIWLKEHGVKYHRLIMDKPRADWYVDDKNMSVEEL